MFKRILIVLAVILLFGAGIVFVAGITETPSGKNSFASDVLRTVGLRKTICDKTTKYSMGAFSEQFGINQDEFLFAMREAESVWEGKLGKNLFEYDEKAPMKVNLIYDERQIQTEENLTLEQEYGKLQDYQGEMQKSFSVLDAEYKEKLKEYNERATEYEKDVENYNDDVNDWNKSTSFSSKKYKALEKKGKKLEEEFKALEELRKEINNLAEEMNKIAKSEESVVSEYNEKVGTYKERFGEAKEFNQGEYNGTEINIYQFRDRNDLVLVLAHELGHVLGIEHVENPKSIMYYLMGEQNLEDIMLTAEDAGALNVVCEIK